MSDLRETYTNIAIYWCQNVGNEGNLHKYSNILVLDCRIYKNCTVMYCFTSRKTLTGYYSDCSK